jgi:hypothetical protein
METARAPAIAETEIPSQSMQISLVIGRDNVDGMNRDQYSVRQ